MAKRARTVSNLRDLAGLLAAEATAAAEENDEEFREPKRTRRPERPDGRPRTERPGTERGGTQRTPSTRRAFSSEPTSPVMPVGFPPTESRNTVQQTPTRTRGPSDAIKALLVVARQGLPRQLEDGQRNPGYDAALARVKSLIAATTREDLARATSLLKQRVISESADPEELNALFAICTAQGRRFEAHDVLAIRDAVSAIRQDMSALRDLMGRSFTFVTKDGEKITQEVARPVEGTSFIRYATHPAALPLYVAVLKAHGMAEAKSLANHIANANQRLLLAQMRKAATPNAETDDGAES